MNNGASQHSVCKSININRKLINEWNKQYPQLINATNNKAKYRCHVMASLVNEIQELGMEVEHIPGGCTYLCQPVDIGINKPYKKHMRHQWEIWMISEEMVNGTTSPPTYEQIVNWAKYANETLSEANIRNAWKHGQYSWFPNELQED